MNLFEHLSYFFNVSRAKSFRTPTQILYLHILWKWNCLRQPAKFTLSDAELSNLTGLSKKSVTDEKRRLKNLGFIDFNSKFGGTTQYKILNRAEQVENEKSRRFSGENCADSLVNVPTKSNLKLQITNCGREGVEKFADININF